MKKKKKNLGFANQILLQETYLQGLSKLFYDPVSGKCYSQHIYGVIRLQKMIKQYKFIIGRMEVNQVTGICIIPSIFKLYVHNYQIKPFWNSFVKKISDNLFLPSSENIVQRPNNIIRTFKKSSWFPVHEYDSKNPITSIPNIFRKNDITETQQITKCKQFQLYLTPQQKKYMKTCIGTYRYFYNRAVSYLNNYDKTTQKTFYYIYPEHLPNLKRKKPIYGPFKDPVQVIVDCSPYKGSYSSYITMRKLIKNNLPNWILPNFPSHLIDQAFVECSSKFSQCMTRYMKTKKPFDFHFKQKKNPVQTINLEKIFMSVNKRAKFSLFKNWKIHGSYVFRNLKLSQNMDVKFCGSTLTYHQKLGKFFLNTSYKTTSSVTSSINVCSIDQGTRTPFTVFTCFDVTKIGDDCQDRLHKVCKEIDIIKSHMDRKQYYYKDENKIRVMVNVTRKKRLALKKALHRKIEYIKNLRNELHWKTIKYLTDNFGHIILPPFKVQEMAGKLCSKVARSMYTFSFYQFKTRLKNKAIEKGVKVHELNEPFTSMTCGKCGNLNRNLGSSKVFTCPKAECKLVIDRDINGARNILLRNVCLM